MGYSYAVIGAGRTGTAAAYDLALHGEADEVRLFDVDAGVALAAAERVGQLVTSAGRPGVRITGAGLDAADLDAVTAAIDGVDAVMSCAPYWYNADLAACSIGVGAHFNDLGGNTAVVRATLAMNEQALAKGVSIVPDCGLAPGLVNTLGAAGIGRLSRCDRVQLRCGGLPENPQGPLDYAISFSISGLTNEYTGEALILRNGALVAVPALAEREEIDFDGLPPLEAFTTSGGTSIAPESFLGVVPDYDYKTIRYVGHLAKLQCLDALGLFSLEPVDVKGVSVVPRRLFEAVAEPRLDFGDPHDMILVRATAEGVDADGVSTRHVFELVDRYDEATGLAAMERCTAFPAAAVTHLQARGIVPPGAQPLETSVAPEPFLEATAVRGLDIVQRVERIA